MCSMDIATLDRAQMVLAVLRSTAEGTHRWALSLRGESFPAEVEVDLSGRPRVTFVAHVDLGTPFSGSALLLTDGDPVFATSRFEMAVSGEVRLTVALGSLEPVEP